MHYCVSLASRTRPDDARGYLVAPRFYLVFSIYGRIRAVRSDGSRFAVIRIRLFPSYLP